mmetsp:Transcript_130514/g.226805  ORF Transcript_130514/g.226805 Transcript_130514/m.226805 type:complete len:1670 (+) Transcript_130514:107-5116(+)
MLHGFLDAANGVPARREDLGEAPRVRQDVERMRASSALRRLLLAASACDGAAGAAATAADEIAQLRADVQRGAAREEQRARLAGYNNWDGIKDRRREHKAAIEGQRADADQRAADMLKRYKNNRLLAKRQADQDPTSPIKEGSRREAAGKASELAEALVEAKAELAAARREADAEAEARKQAVQDTERLGKRLRRTEAEAQTAQEDAEAQRAEEAAILKRLREEVTTARSKATSESREAAEARQAAQEEAADAAEAARAARLADDARNAEAAEASELRGRYEAKLLEALEAQRNSAAEASSEAQQAQAAAAARAADAAAHAEALAHAHKWGAEQDARAKSVARDAVVDRALQALLVRREEAARRMLAHSMAAHLDTLVRGVFHAWRDAEALQREVSCAREKAVALEEERSAAEETVRRLQEQIEASESHHSSSAAQLLKDLEAEQAEVARLRENCRSAEAEVDLIRRRAAEEALTASAAASEAEARNGLAARSTALLLARRVESCRHVLATLLASQIECTVRGAFGAWRESVEQLALEANSVNDIRSQVSEVQEAAKKAADAHAAELAEHLSKAEKTSKELADTAAELQCMRERSAQQDLAEEMLANEAVAQARAASAAQASASEGAKVAMQALRQGEEASQQAAKLAEDRAAAEFRSEAMAAREEHSKSIEAKEAEVDRLKRYLKKANADVESHQLAKADAEARLAERQASTGANAGDLLREEARAALALQRESLSRRVFASMLASHLELQLRGAFGAWCAVLIEAHISEEEQRARAAAASAAREQAAASARELAAEVAAAAELRQRLRETTASEAAAAEASARSRETDAMEVAALTTEVTQLREAAAAGTDRAPSLNEQVAQAILMRREETSRRVVATLLAHHLELTARGAFCAWRAACERDEAQEELLQLHKSSRLEITDLEERNASLRDELNKTFQELKNTQAARAAAPDPNLLARTEERLNEMEEELLRVLEAKGVAEQRLEVAIARCQAAEANGLEGRAPEASGDVLSELAKMAFILQREQASRNLVSSLIAAQIEHLVRGVFNTWHDAAFGERHTPSAEMTAKAAPVAERAGAARELQQSASLAVLHKAMSAARGMLGTLLGRHMEALVLGAFIAWSDATVEHRHKFEKAVFHGWAKHLANAKKGLLKKAFEVWQDVAHTMAVASGSAVDGEAAELREKLRRIEAELQEARSSRELPVAPVQTPTKDWEERVARLELERNNMSTTFQARIDTLAAQNGELLEKLSMASKASQQHAEETKSLKQQIEMLETRLQEAEERHQQAQEACGQANQLAVQATRDRELELGKVQALQKDVQDLTARAESAEAQPAAVIYARREAATRCVLAHLLASQMEMLVRGAFHSWHLAGQLQLEPPPMQDPTTSAEVSSAREETRMAAQLAQEVSLTARLVSRREETTRRMFASVLAMQLEFLVRGVFCSWRDVERAKAVTKIVGGRHDGQAIRLRGLERHVRAKERQHGEHHPEVAHALLAVADHHGQHAAATASAASEAEILHLEKAHAILKRHEDKSAAAAVAEGRISGARSRLATLRNLETTENKGDWADVAAAIVEHRLPDVAEVEAVARNASASTIQTETTPMARHASASSFQAENTPALDSPDQQAEPVQEPVQEPVSPGSGKAIQRSPSAEWYQDDDFEVDSDPEL